jgi:hypothetical protein
MGIARYYDQSKNEYNAAHEPLRAFPGVPLGDIDAALWETFPAWLQADVDASDLYRKTAPDKPKATAKADKE